MPVGDNCNIALFDMDGTLFDYDYTMRTWLKKLASPGEGINWDDPSLDPHAIGDAARPWVQARIDMIRNTPGWWRDLPKLQLGWDLHRVAKGLGFDVHILTKGPSSRPHAWQEKVECLRKHFDPKEITIHITEQKAGRYGRVLVDDYPDYVQQWLEHRKRGLVIMPKNKSNENFNHPNVIHYDGSAASLDKCTTALAAAFERKSKQHWKDLLG
jgi:hypothetical protein